MKKCLKLHCPINKIANKNIALFVVIGPLWAQAMTEMQILLTDTQQALQTSTRDSEDLPITFGTWDLFHSFC